MGWQLGGVPIGSVFESASNGVSFDDWIEENTGAPHHLGANVSYAGHSPFLPSTYLAKAYGSSAGSGKLYIRCDGNNAGYEDLSVYEMFAAKGSSTLSAPTWDTGISNEEYYGKNMVKNTVWSGSMTADIKDWLEYNSLPTTGAQVIGVSNPVYSGSLEISMTAPTLLGYILTSTIGGEAGTSSGQASEVYRNITVRVTNDIGDSANFIIKMRFKIITTN